MQEIEHDDLQLDAVHQPVGPMDSVAPAGPRLIVKRPPAMSPRACSASRVGSTLPTSRISSRYMRMPSRAGSGPGASRRGGRSRPSEADRDAADERCDYPLESARRGGRYRVMEQVV
jgi:hypothetical protein